MLTLFVIGSFWFWALLVVAYVAITALSEIDSPAWATITLIITGLLLQWFGQVHIFQWIKTHPKELLLYLFAYLLIGAVYSVLKWSSFIRKQAKQIRADYIRRGYDGSDIKAPDVEEFSSRIIGWMGYWPFNIFWTLLNDPIRAFFQWLFASMKSLFQRIADHAYAQASRDVAKAKK